MEALGPQLSEHVLLLEKRAPGAVASSYSLVGMIGGFIDALRVSAALFILQLVKC